MVENDLSINCLLNIDRQNLLNIDRQKCQKMLMRKGELCFNSVDRSFTAKIHGQKLYLPANDVQKLWAKRRPNGTTYIIRYKKETDNGVKELVLKGISQYTIKNLHSLLLDLVGVESARNKHPKKQDGPSHQQEQEQRQKKSFNIDTSISNQCSAEQIVTSFIRFVTQRPGENACSLVDVFLQQSIIPVQVQPLIGQQLNKIATNCERSRHNCFYCSRGE